MNRELKTSKWKSAQFLNGFFRYCRVCQWSRYDKTSARISSNYLWVVSSYVQKLVRYLSSLYPAKMFFGEFYVKWYFRIMLNLKNVLVLKSTPFLFSNANIIKWTEWNWMTNLFYDINMKLRNLNNINFQCNRVAF